MSVLPQEYLCSRGGGKLSTDMSRIFILPRRSFTRCAPNVRRCTHGGLNWMPAMGRHTLGRLHRTYQTKAMTYKRQHRTDYTQPTTRNRLHTNRLHTDNFKPTDCTPAKYTPSQWWALRQHNCWTLYMSHSSDQTLLVLRASMAARIGSQIHIRKAFSEALRKGTLAWSQRPEWPSHHGFSKGFTKCHTQPLQQVVNVASRL